MTMREPVQVRHWQQWVPVMSYPDWALIYKEQEVDSGHVLQSASTP